ncbi:hypothetical protein Tco_0353934, partial [Tanacetum coccineum]
DVPREAEVGESSGGKNDDYMFEVHDPINEYTWQNAKRALNVINESDNEDVDQDIILEAPPGHKTDGNDKRASTPPKEVSHVWTSNGAWCSKGTRIILGWNSDNVDVRVVS